MATLAIGGSIALVASVGAALTDTSTGCTLSPPDLSPPDLSPPDTVLPDLSPPDTVPADTTPTTAIDVSPPECPPVSPPESPPLSPVASPTLLLGVGPSSVVDGSTAVLTAQLTAYEFGPGPFPGQTLSFTLGNGSTLQRCSATTGDDGVASCSVDVDQSRGSNLLTVVYEGDGGHMPTSSLTAVTVAMPTALTTTGPGTIAVGGPATLSTRLADRRGAPVPSEPVMLTLGTAPNAQSCTGTTGPDGVASCVVPVVVQPLGPSTVAASFSADAGYLSSTASAATVVYRYSTGGAFVIGDVNAGAPTVGNGVTFWGSKWAKSTSLSGGATPKQMVGFAPGAAVPACGASWSTGSGDTGLAPATVPTYTAMIVTSQIAKTGGVLSGDTVHVVVVRTEPGYGPTPGAAGRGTVVAVIC